MLSYLARRLLLACVTVLVSSFVAYLVIDLPPGDFVSDFVARQVDISGGGQMVDQLRQQWGFDQPLLVRYFKWLRQMALGSFGSNIPYGINVPRIVGDTFLLTIILALVAVILTWLIAVPIGIYSALRQYSLGDYVFTFFGFLGLGIPSFLLALVIMYIAFVRYGLNLTGLLSPEYVTAPWSMAKAWDLMKHVPLPAFILMMGSIGGIIRVLRANLLDELHKPYVITARAKGLPESRLIFKYPVRVAMNPLISTIGYLLPFIVSGSTVLSVVMSLPTLGAVLYTALTQQDMFAAATIILLLSIMTVVGTLISDILLMLLDPRIRMEAD